MQQVNNEYGKSNGSCFYVFVVESIVECFIQVWITIMTITLELRTIANAILIFYQMDVVIARNRVLCLLAVCFVMSTKAIGVQMP